MSTGEMMFEIEVSKQMNYVSWKHSPITKTIDMIENNLKILDVGCSYGYVGKELKRKNCVTYGVELDREMAKIAEKNYERVVVGDIEQLDGLPFENNFFDYMLYLDVLEHLARPDLVLMNFKRYLKKTGKIIISLPNIGRWEYRLQLLLGRFEYSNTGALSKGHLRFFTYKTACNLVENAGLIITHVDYTGLASIIKIFPKITSFQFLISAVK